MNKIPICLGMDGSKKRTAPNKVVTFTFELYDLCYYCIKTDRLSLKVTLSVHYKRKSIKSVRIGPRYFKYSRSISYNILSREGGFSSWFISGLHSWLNVSALSKIMHRIRSAHEGYSTRVA